MKGKNRISLISLIILIGLIIIFGLLLTVVSAVEALRIMAAFVFVLFLPGYIFSYILFDSKKRKFDIVERIVLAFAFSLVLVPLVIFYLNKVGMKITTGSTVVVVLVVNGVLVLGYLLKRVFEKRK